MGYNPNIPHLEVPVGEISHFLSIDPNFQRDIQVGYNYKEFKPPRIQLVFWHPNDPPSISGILQVHPKTLALFFAHPLDNVDPRLIRQKYLENNGRQENGGGHRSEWVGGSR